jgi:hypothetical protein
MNMSFVTSLVEYIIFKKNISKLNYRKRLPLKFEMFSKLAFYYNDVFFNIFVNW